MLLCTQKNNFIVNSMVMLIPLLLTMGLAAALNLEPVKKETPDNSCLTKDNEVGVCVAYYQCNDNGTFNTDGIGIIDVRGGDAPCPSYLDTCCKFSDTRAPDDPITPKPLRREGCGWRNPGGIDGLKVDSSGDNARFGEFPWVIAILKVEPLIPEKPEKTYNLYVGGGSLIHPSVVLTAAHLLEKGRHYRARAGEWDTQTEKEIYPYQEREVANVVIHDQYNRKNLHNDIALLFLGSAVNLAPNVGVACMPTPEAVPSGKCFASGWGKDQFGKQGRYQTILKKVELPVVEHKACEAQLRETRLGRHFKLSKTFMCAGGGNQDTCKGDGGAPLSCSIPYHQDRYTVSGIVSWGIGCGQQGNPGVYVDVATLRPWIDKNVAIRGFDTKVYTLNFDI